LQTQKDYLWTGEATTSMILISSTQLGIGITLSGVLQITALAGQYSSTIIFLQLLLMVLLLLDFVNVHQCIIKLKTYLSSHILMNNLGVLRYFLGTEVA